LSPQFVVVHGAGEGGAGRALGAFQQTREFEAEAKRREGEYQLQKKLALRQMELAEQQNVREERGLQLSETGQAFNQAQATQAAARDERMVASSEKFNVARARGFEQEFEIAASEEERAKEIQKRRIEEIDKGLDQERALAMFQSMEAAGIDLREDRGMREGIKAAGKVLGGGIGQALALMANAGPDAQAVFQRLPPEYRGRYLVDMAEDHKLRRMEVEREQGLELAQTLVETGDIAPEDGEAVRKAIAEAEDEGALRGALEPLFGARRNAVVKATKARQKARLAGSIEKRIVQMQEVDGFEHVLERYEAMLEELARDPNPNMQAWSERISAVTGSPVANPEDEIPMPDFGARRQPGGGVETQAQAAPTAQPAPPPIEGGEELELGIVEGLGIPTDGTATPEEQAEVERELADTRKRAMEAAKKYERAAGENQSGERLGGGEATSLRSFANEARVPVEYLSAVVNEQRKGLKLKEKAQTAMRELRGVVDLSMPDERIVTEFVRARKAKDRAEARELLAYLRRTDR